MSMNSDEDMVAAFKRVGMEAPRDWTEATREQLLSEIERLRGRINEDRPWPTVDLRPQTPEGDNP